MSSRVFPFFALASMALACASGEGPRPEVPSSAPAGTPAVASEPEASFESEDQVWMIDEDGEFYLEAYPKAYPFRRTSEGRAKLGWGVEVIVMDEDDDYLYFRVSRVGEDPMQMGPAKPTPEDQEAVAATYRFETPNGDRLRFLSFADGLPEAGMWRNGFEIADIDGDGFLDIVHGPMRKGLDVPVIYRGDGQGGWSQWMDPTFPRGMLDYGDVAVADFSGNGLMDLAVASHFRGIVVFAQEEPGRFVPWSEGIDFAIPWQTGGEPVFSSRRIVAADWSGNGRPDIIALDEGPRLGPGARGDRQTPGAGPIEVLLYGPVIYLNRGDGTWGRIGGEEPNRFELFGDDLAVADLTGDGRLDFLTSTNMMTRRDLLHLAQEDGTWQATDLEVRPLAYIRSVAAGDFDGDGRTDIVLSFLSFELGTWRNGLDLFLARDHGWERHTLFAREGRQAFTALEAGDLTGNGNLDLVAADMNGHALVLLGDGRGGFTLEDAPELQQPFRNCRAYQVRLADIDGSGRDEIVIAYADEASPLTAAQRCPSQGGIMAWTVEEKPTSTRGRGAGRR